MNSLAVPEPNSSVQSPEEHPAGAPLGTLIWTLLSVAFLALAGVMVWQALAVGGAPDPTKPSTGPGTALFDIGVLVFREGLECILVLAAIVASMRR